MIVIPNVMGISVWSPRLDELGNSVRGIDFCKELVKRFNFHVFDSLIQHTNKNDPRFKRNEEHVYGVDSLCWAASQGDLHEVQRIAATGLNLNDSDYDGRTSLHLASSEGKDDIIRFLLGKNINPNPIDRWGNTPLDDAHKSKNAHVAKILKDHGGKRMKK